MTSIFGLKTLSNILLALSNSLHYSCRPSSDSPHVSLWIFENQSKMMIFRFFQNLSKINRKRLQIRFLVSERLYQILEAFVLQYIAIAIILEASPKVWIFGRIAKNDEFQQCWRRSKVANSSAGNGRKIILWLKTCSFKFFEFFSYLCHS